MAKKYTEAQQTVVDLINEGWELKVSEQPEIKGPRWWKSPTGKMIQRAYPETSPALTQKLGRWQTKPVKLNVFYALIFYLNKKSTVKDGDLTITTFGLR